MCHIIDVTPFNVTLKPGESIFDQVVYAAQKAFVRGEFLPGQPFPSVRALAASFKIHPNTGHKVIQHLIQERLLESRPGLGTVVAERPEVRSGDKKRVLQHEVEQLVVAAKHVGVELEDVVSAVETQWAKLEPAVEKNRK